ALLLTSPRDAARRGAAPSSDVAAGTVRDRRPRAGGRAVPGMGGEGRSADLAGPAARAVRTPRLALRRRFILRGEPPAHLARAAGRGRAPAAIGAPRGSGVSGGTRRPRWRRRLEERSSAKGLEAFRGGAPPPLSERGWLLSHRPPRAIGRPPGGPR